MKNLCQQKTFYDLIRYLPVAAYVCAPDGRIIQHNRRAVELWGYEPPLNDESLRYCACHRVFLPDGTCLAPENTPMAQVLKTGETLQNLEAEIERPDGTRFTATASITAIRDEDGNIIGAINCFHDITYRKRIERALKCANDEVIRAKDLAEAASQAKSAFLANVSHEIRTPLAAIMGFTNFLLDPLLPPSERMEMAGIIKRNGEVLMRIINDVLDLSKIESGHVEIEKTRFDLSELIEDVRALMHLKAQEKGIAFEICYVSKPAGEISGDPIKLRQILMNVIGNAVKFTDKGSVRCEIRCEPRGPGNCQLRFTVRDTGTGIPRDQHERIFHPFVQADLSLSRRFGGTGLGLFIARRLAERLGGRIFLIESAPEVGSVFEIVLDAEVLRKSRKMGRSGIGESSASLEVRRQPLEGISLLLAEDTPDNQLLMQKTLKSIGADVDVANNGSEAVEKALARDYDVILMDLQMPVLDGYAATAQLRGKRYVRPIIALTAHAMRDERVKALGAGFDDYLTKPLDRSALVKTLSAWKAENVRPRGFDGWE